MNDRVALRGDLLDFTADPAWGEVDSAAVRFRPGHWLLAEAGRIVAVQEHAPGEGWERVDQAGRLILPGFIDTHVHSPQLDVIASYGTELLDWLNTYTFPAERRYADAAEARERRGALPRRTARARHDRSGGLPDGAQGLVRPPLRRGASSAACASSPARC